MRQVCVNERQHILVVEVPDPTVSPGHVLVRNHYSMISSGTELAPGHRQPSRIRQRVDLIRKFGASLQQAGLTATLDLVRQRLVPPPRLQGRGYSTAGVVVQVGDGIDDLRVGDLVACGGSSANHAEVIIVPRNLLVPVPLGVNLREACLTTLGAIAMQGVRRAQVSVGETVVVIGLGLVGQLVSQLLQVAGCRVIAIDLLDRRLDLAAELGAHYRVHASAEDPIEGVYRITGDPGADAVIVCAATASDEPVNQAFRMCRERGRVVVVGEVGLNLERTHFYQKELDLLISRSYGPGRYDAEYEQLGLDYPIGYVRWTENRNMAEFVRLLAEGNVKIAPLISAEYPLEQAAQAYRDLAEKPNEMLAIIFRYDNPSPVEARSRVVHLKRAIQPKPGKVKIAVIGAGSFARAYHLPNLRTLPTCELVAIVNSTGSKARQIAQEFGAAYCTTDYREVLADQTIDAVIITTRHHLHAEIAIAAVQRGKHVFVEKPMGLTVEECQQICQAVADAEVLLAVGFNRRFAPLICEMKRTLAAVPGPKMLWYRVNAGWLPPDHWLLDPRQGGGRLLGEGCHFFDLLSFLMGAEPIRIGASQVRPAEGHRSDPANASVCLEFTDGSVGTLLYTVVGHHDLSKERLEVFTGGKALVLDDFRSLDAYGFQRWTSSPSSGDKGHRQVLQHFCDAVLGSVSLEVTAQDGLRATVCALKAQESLQAGSYVSISQSVA